LRECLVPWRGLGGKRQVAYPWDFPRLLRLGVPGEKQQNNAHNNRERFFVHGSLSSNGDIANRRFVNSLF
jgi:hypothetical protein